MINDTLPRDLLWIVGLILALEFGALRRTKQMVSTDTALRYSARKQ
jgi:hypothetical protein